jgi:hypothetical protein
MLKDGTAYKDLGADHFDRRPVELKANPSYSPHGRDSLAGVA